MSHFRRQILLKSFQLADIFILVLSFTIAILVTFQRFDLESLNRFLSIRVSIQNFIFVLGFILIWHFIFSTLGLYHSMRLSSRRLEAIDICKATTLGTVVVFIASQLFGMSIITPLFLLVFWETSMLVTLFSRLVLRFSLDQIRVRGRNLRIILLVGTNERVIQFAKKIINKPTLGYELVGFVDYKWADQPDKDLITDYPLIHPDSLPDYMRDNVVDEVVIGLPMKTHYNYYDQIIDLCIEQGIHVRLLSNMFFNQLAKSRIEIFEGDQTITLYTGSLNYGALLVKRLLDIVLSLILLVLLTPVFIITAIVVKINSPGPIFFCQNRLGLNKRLFKLYKIRTMFVGAENMQQDLEELNEAEGPVFKIKNDPRITSVGHFLRKSSIDELPQLFNVLKGDMSLVGPRPLPERDYKEFDQRWFSRRFSVRPGITCLWQITGRSDIPFSKWIELDLRYIDNWSLQLDFWILIRTIPAVFKGAGAA